ncbi:MAG: CHAT domain-containing protein [Bacteroidota bacterium]
MIPPLFYNKVELESLKAMGPGYYLFDHEAVIDKFRSNATKHSIIHFATHAISSTVDGLNSRIYLNDGNGEPAYITADDIGRQTLNADLVTLSACETGGGSQNILEGTIGLTKAFLAAGARSVVASNWAVDDFATAELMQYFYAALRQGKTPDRALQDARREYLTKHPDAHPAKWAAFEAYGGMVAPQWAEAKPWYQSFWPYLAGFLLLLLGGVTYKRRNYA